VAALCAFFFKDEQHRAWSSAEILFIASRGAEYANRVARKSTDAGQAELKISRTGTFSGHQRPAFGGAASLSVTTVSDQRDGSKKSSRKRLRANLREARAANSQLRRSWMQSASHATRAA
jgi:hypothetical protein